MAICEYGYHETQQKTNINDGELLCYLEIINKERLHPIVVRQEFHIEKGLFGSSKYDWYNVFVDLGKCERQILYSCVKRDIVRAYLWGTVHGIEQLNKTK